MITLNDLKTTKKNTWCPGCGNFGILMAFKRTLTKSKLKREKIVIVSGIGCHGKMVNYVNVNGFHGLHGRSLPLASGIKLANPKLNVICFAGDADQYDEGWGHLTHTIRRNINLKLIVHNNMVLGLTTGQTTATSQEKFKTKSTPFGVIPPMLNPLAHALVSNGTFVARGFAGDVPHLTNLILDALKHKGFAFIDVLQPCVTFNHLNTYDWYNERIYKLEEINHDYTNREIAIKKSFEWDKKIPIGIFYKEERQTYLEHFPFYEKEKSIVNQSKPDLTSIIKKMI